MLDVAVQQPDRDAQFVSSESETRVARPALPPFKE